MVIDTIILIIYNEFNVIKEVCMNGKSKSEELSEEERQKIVQVLEKYGNSKLNILNTLLEIQKVSDNRYSAEIGRASCRERV